MTRAFRLLGPAIAVLAAPAVAGAQDLAWEVGSASSFTSGNYGTATSTDVWHTPLLVKRLFADGDVTVVLPLMCLWGTGVTVIDGSPVPIGRAPGTRGSEPGGRTAAPAPAETTPVSSCGLGDVVVRGRYYLFDGGGMAPTVAALGHVKAPSASARNGFGTGRPDEGLGVEVTQPIGADFFAMLDGGFTFIGNPNGVEYENRVWYDIGAGRDLRNGAVTLSVFFAEYSAIVPGLPAARDLVASVTVRRADRWRLQATGQFGLSDGAPDGGLTLGVSRRF
jgi:hypothetical protein